ncbi:MAG: sigma-70 family RNA polymerase sigma factor [Planctomycetes bacterium]|nr:sigma-70 family RNA polymerase sigma factor [Planctomycetota bacterium]
MTRERLERCFDECAQRAWRLAVHWLGDAHEAFDVVQQAFVVAATKPDAIPHDNTWPWFRQVVIHEARNARRKKRPATSEQESNMADPGPDPADAATKAETSAELRQALDTLPEREREAIVLTHLNGMTHAQAAAALGIPVKTLSSHVSRGLDRLKGRLGGKGETMLASLAAAPLMAPPGGWEGALAAWKAAAFSSLTTGATAGAVATGALMMKKSLAIAGMIVALGVGLGGGALIMQSTSNPPPRTDISAAPADASERSGSAPLEMTGDDSKPDVSEWSSRLDSARAAEKQAREEAEALRAKLKTLESERDTAVASAEKLEAELAPIRAEQAERGPTFTFGKYGTIEGVTGSNWKELAGASHEVITNLRLLREAQLKGEQPSREVYLKIQENTEKMRTYEYDTIGVLPTWARHNGEFTHPISHSNLIASELKTAGLPLSEAQIAEIKRLGLQWEADYDAAQKKYNDATPRVEKMLDEYVLKGAFVDAVWDLLTQEQRDVFIDPKWLHVAHVDLYCTTLMIIHTSPILTGADIGEVRTKLQQTLVKNYAIPEDQIEALGPILDTWQSDVAGIIAPVAKAQTQFYTYDQGAIAARATVKLVKAIRDYGMLDDEHRAALLDAYEIYIPRVIAGE